MTTVKFAWTFVLTGAILTAACGDSKTSMLPTAPSAVGAAVQAEEAGDAVSGSMAKGGNGKGNGNDTAGNGNGNGNGNNNGGGNNGGGNGNGNGNQPNVPPTLQPPTNTTPTTTTRKVEIQGPITAAAGDTITVRGQEVTVPSTCVIRHGNTTFSVADLTVGALVHVKGTRTTTGTGATATTTIECNEIFLQNANFGGGDGDDDGEDPTSLVSVSATDSVASETGTNTGAFRITRAGTAAQLAMPLTVTYTLTGTATNGVDYTSVPLTATFLASQATVDVVVTPVADATTEGAETVVLTLTTVTPYELGAPATATVTITDTDSPLVSVTAYDSTASETGTTGPDQGTFRFTRTGSTAAVLTVTFTVSGTATSGVDYQALPVTVTFGVGQATADLAVIPVPDGTTEGSESVVVTVTDGASYDLAAPSTATVNIAG